MGKKSFSLSRFFFLLALTFLFVLPGSSVLAGHEWGCEFLTISFDCNSCHMHLPDTIVTKTINLYDTPNVIGMADLYIEYDTEKLEYIGYDAVNCLPETFNHMYGVMDVGSGTLYAYTMAGDPIPAGSTGCLFNINFGYQPTEGFQDICIVDLGDSDLQGWCELPICCNVSISPESEAVYSEESIQFSAGSLYCDEVPLYSWEVTSTIGSSIDANGLYVAGINETSGSVQDEVQVIDEANKNVFDVAIVTILPFPCELTLSPKSQTILSGETIQFNASEDGGCDASCYTWDITSAIGSTIDGNGFYTAGNVAGTDTVTVTDPCNGNITNFTTVNVALDSDDDGISDDEDNCTYTPNGPKLGTCVKLLVGIVKGTGVTCTNDEDCEDGECDVEQGDCNVNIIGDVCECYADLDGDGCVYPSDLSVILDEFGRTDCFTNPCQADIDKDGNVYPSDLSIFIDEYGKEDCPTVPE